MDQEFRRCRTELQAVWDKRNAVTGTGDPPAPPGSGCRRQSRTSTVAAIPLPARPAAAVAARFRGRQLRGARSRAARRSGATCSSRRGSSASWPFTLLADARDAWRSRSPTSTSTSRSRSSSWGSRTTRPARRQAGLGLARSSPSSSPLLGCRSSSCCRSPSRCCSTARACAARARSGSCSSCPTWSRSWPGVLIWQGMLNLETGWVNAVPALHRHREPAGLAQRPAVDLSRRWSSSGSGASAPGSSSTSPACAASRPSSTTRRASTAPGSGRRCAT